MEINPFVKSALSVIKVPLIITLSRNLIREISDLAKSKSLSQGYVRTININGQTKTIMIKLIFNFLFFEIIY